MSNLDKKIEQAKRLLRLAEDEAASHGQPVEISYSGGKDSDIILHLAREAGINHRAIYKMTTIDPAGTIQHCREAGAEILKPKRSFFELIQTSGFPTRRARFCCDRLKEYKVLEVAVQGIRRSESHDRERRYSEPTICRIYGSKKNHVSVYLPILEWTEDDVKQYIEANAIHCHSIYYRGGAIRPDTEARLPLLPIAEPETAAQRVQAVPRNGRRLHTQRPHLVGANQRNQPREIRHDLRPFLSQLVLQQLRRLPTKDQWLLRKGRLQATT